MGKVVSGIRCKSLAPPPLRGIGQMSIDHLRTGWGRFLKTLFFLRKVERDEPKRNKYLAESTCSTRKAESKRGCSGRVLCGRRGVQASDGPIQSYLFKLLPNVESLAGQALLGLSVSVPRMRLSHADNYEASHVFPPQPTASPTIRSTLLQGSSNKMTSCHFYIPTGRPSRSNGA